MEMVVVDVREFPEYAAGHIADAKLVPLGTLAQASDPWDKAQPITLVCKTGRRAEQACQQLQAKGFTAVTVLPGGMEAWHAAGKPILVVEHRPWSMERQVRTVAGSLVLLTLALGFFASPYLLLATAFVGAGLVSAGGQRYLHDGRLSRPDALEPPATGGRMTPATIAGGLILGVVIGIVSGLIGIGGGAFLIPALIFFYGMSQIEAQGTSLATLLLPIGVFAFWTYYKAGHVDLKLALLIAVGFAAGGWVGGVWAQHLSALLLRRGFALLLVLLAAKLVLTK